MSFTLYEPVCECGSDDVWDIAPDGTCFCRACKAHRPTFHWEAREVAS